MTYNICFISFTLSPHLLTVTIPWLETVSGSRALSPATEVLRVWNTASTLRRQPTQLTSSVRLAVTSSGLTCRHEDTSTLDKLKFYFLSDDRKRKRDEHRASIDILENVRNVWLKVKVQTVLWPAPDDKAALHLLGPCRETHVKLKSESEGI